MDVMLSYAKRLGGWALLLFTLLALSELGGDQPWSLTARLPGLATFALVLACFPAGLGVGDRALRSSASFFVDGLRLTMFSIVLGVLVFAMVQYVVPTALSGGRRDPSGGVEVREMTLPVLRSHGREVVERAERGPPTDLAAWRAANTFAFEHERRLAHATLPFFLTWLGILGGFWGDRIDHRSARVTQQLVMGLFLLVSMYLGGENGFELVALRASAPAYFAAWFIVFVPAVLGVGLGWPTLIVLFTSDNES